MTSIEEVRSQVENMGGSVSDPTPMANWIEIHGAFTPAQLRKLAKAVEKNFNKQKLTQN